MASDEQLMLGFVQGSRDCFAELFDRYRQPVYAFFRRRLEDAGRAEELAQETFLAILRGTERYQPSASFRTYLYAIARRQLFNEWRRLRQRTSPISEMAAPCGGELTDANWVKAAMEQLTPEHREVLMLREYEELSYEEVAALLRIPVNTVRSRLFRARSELKLLLLPGDKRCKTERTPS
jgi:RNA polymerase sigma-70 factor, ECF subfamily